MEVVVVVLKQKMQRMVRILPVLLQVLDLVVEVEDKTMVQRDKVDLHH